MMMINQKYLKTIHGEKILVQTCKMFTYPSKFADSYTPEIMEVNLPEYEFIRPEIKIIAEQGVAKSPLFNPSTITTKRRIKNILLNKKASNLNMQEKYVYDIRDKKIHNLTHALWQYCVYILELSEFEKVTVVLPQNSKELIKPILDTFGLFDIIYTDDNIEGNIIKLIDDNNRLLDEPVFVDPYQKLEFEGYKKDTPEKLFISRKGRRKLTNEYDVENYLSKYGFKKIYLEDLKMSEKFSVWRNAKIVVSIFGAGIAPMAFNQNQVKLIELCHPGFTYNCYRLLASYVGGKCCKVIGKITDDVLKKLEVKHNYYAKHDITIDLKSLQMALDSIISS